MCIDCWAFNLIWRGVSMYSNKSYLVILAVLVAVVVLVPLA